MAEATKTEIQLAIATSTIEALKSAISDLQRENLELRRSQNNRSNHLPQL